MRVLYDHQFFTMFRFSGITRYLYELISRLCANEDVKVSLYMGWNICGFDFNRYAHKYHRYFSKNRPSIPKTGKMFRALNRLGFAGFAYSGRHDIYHQTYYQHLIPYSRSQRIVTVYDMTYEIYPHMFPPSPEVWQKRRSIESAGGILAISNSTKNDLINLLNVPADKIQVTHLANSLTCEVNQPSPLSNPYLLYVGQRCPHKNFGRLLEVYCRTNSIHNAVDLVCFGGSPLTTEENSLIYRHSLQNRIHHTQGPDEKLAQYYTHATALVYPSFYEGFGMPVLEAMHYGCPVAASGVSSLPEVGGDAALYFKPDSLEEMREVLCRILLDSELRRNMSTQGSLQEKKFTWDECARRTLEFYKTFT